MVVMRSMADSTNPTTPSGLLVLLFPLTLLGMRVKPVREVNFPKPTWRQMKGAHHPERKPAMKSCLSILSISALCIQMAVTPAAADMSNDEKAAAAAAIAILGIAALAHHKHHYKGGYRPSDATETAEFERGYRDGLHGYSYWEYSQTRGYVEGYHAGENERMNSVSHRRIPTDQRASPMAYNGCANIVAQNFAVGRNNVHFIKVRSPEKHKWEIEAAVGYEHMVCTMRDSGELIDLRGGRL